MSELFQYLLQSSVSIAVLYGIYILFLRNDTFFKLNRFYLVASALVSLALPMINLAFSVNVAPVSFTYTLDIITITPQEVRDTVNTYFNFFQVVLIVYLTGVVLFSLRLIFQVLQII